MSTQARKERILNLLRNISRFVTVEQLSEQLFVSAATVRRDLREMEEGGLIRRTRGGAMLLESIAGEAPILLRENRNEMQKHIIAGLALPYIKDGMTIFMDSSSTVFALAGALSELSNLRIITNNLKVVWLLAQRKGFTLMCTGGSLDAPKMSFSGLSALRYVQGLNADAAFLSAQGFVPETGTYESIEETNEFKRACLENSRKKYLLCDTSKLGKHYLYHTAPLCAYDHIITENRELNQQINEQINEQKKAPGALPH